jgi:hypothetical protein
MASAGRLLSQPVKVVTVAAVMNPPPAMRKMCRLFMVWLLVKKCSKRSEHDCLELGAIAQLHKTEHQSFIYEHIQLQLGAHPLFFGSP